MTKKEEIDAFMSKIIHGQTKTLLLGNNMHVMSQSLKGGDGPHVHHSLTVMNTNTEVGSRNKWVAVVAKGLMAIPVTIVKGVKVAQVVAANVVPQVEVVPETLEELDELQSIQQAKMFVERRGQCSSSN